MRGGPEWEILVRVYESVLESPKVFFFFFFFFLSFPSASFSFLYLFYPPPPRFSLKPSKKLSPGFPRLEKLTSVYGIMALFFIFFFLLLFLPMLFLLLCQNRWN